MLWTPQKGRQKVIHNYGVVGALMGTAVVSNGTTLLDGTVTELISAANNIQDSWGIFITISDTGSSGAARDACFDILIGGATDDVLIAALIGGYISGTASQISYFFPVHIPQGKRIAATHANVGTSISARVGIQLMGGGIPPFKVGRKVTTYGTQADNASGQSITPAASGGAASATQLTASTTEDHFAFMPGFQLNSSVGSLKTLNIGIGVGASTEDRIGTWIYRTNITEDCLGPSPPWPAFQDVPAGSRLTMLASNSGTNDTDYTGLIYAVS